MELRGQILYKFRTEDGKVVVDTYGIRPEYVGTMEDGTLCTGFTFTKEEAIRQAQLLVNMAAKLEDNNVKDAV